MKPSPKVTPDQWARANRVYPETAGIPGPRDPALTPYFIPLSRAIHEGEYRRYVAITAAQSGKTDTLLDVMGARLDQKAVPIAYAGPTRELVTDAFEPRFMELLDQAPSLKDKVIRGRRMKKTLKWVNAVPVRLVHAGSSAALKSFPAGLALVDEYDEMLANIRGQGSPLELLEARGDTYSDFKTVIVSTCSLGVVETEVDPVTGLEFWRVAGDPKEIESPIWKLWQQGTRYHWAWPCPHCGEFFIPRSKLLRYPKRATPAQAKRGTWLACPHCGGEILDREHKAEMNRRGVYVAPGQSIDRDGTVRGSPPDTSTYSIWTSGLASPFVTWGERVEALLEAEAEGDPDKIQTAMNAGFGELFAPGGGEVPEWQEIMKHRLPYLKGTVPQEATRIFCAVDVQKMSLIYLVRAFGSRGTSWLVDYGQIYGPTDHGEVWADLADYLLTPIGGMQIERAFIDSGFRPDKPDAGDEHRVYEFVRRYPWLCVPTKGQQTMRTPFSINRIEIKPNGKRAPYSIKLCHVNTDFFKSLVHSRIRTPVTEPGAWYVPDDVDEDYCRQVVSEARVIQDGKPRWIQRARANHFFDCEALVALAGYQRNVDRIPDGVSRSSQDDDAPPLGAAPVPTSTATGDAGAAAATQAVVSTLRDRFRNNASRFHR